MRLLTSFLATFFLTAVPVLSAPWLISPDSRVTVEVKWVGGTAKVVFPEILGEIDFDARHPERVDARVYVSSQAGTTGVGLADQLLHSSDYLASSEYPEIGFVLNNLKQTSKSTADISGDITLRGITHAVEFRASVFRYGPATSDPDRFEAGFDLVGEIDRSEFGSDAGAPGIATDLPIRIKLLISSK